MKPMNKFGIALQLYTVRNEAEQDYVGTLRKAAALGYEGFEFAGYGGLSASDIQELLRELNVKAVSTHVGVEQLRNNLDNEIALAAAIGTPYVVCPYLPDHMRNSEAALKESILLFQESSRRLAERGIQFGYHNHDFELVEQLGGKSILDRLLESTIGSMFAELDVCWVQYGGQDPVYYIRKYAGRTPLIHLKDLSRTADGKAITMELGKGELDLPAVIAAASESGSKWLIVEQDICQDPPLTSIANSLEWLRSNGYTSK